MLTQLIKALPISSFSAFDSVGYLHVGSESGRTGFHPI